MDVKLSKLATGSLIAGILGLITPPIVGLIALMLGVIALYKIRASSGLLKGGGMAIAGIALGIIALLCLVYGVVNFRASVRAFKIPSESMSPTVKQNQRIMVDRKSYVSNSPQLGDIVVFQLEENGKKKLQCKRIMGLPGEIIEIKNGQLYVNDSVAQIPDLPKSVYYINGGSFGGEGQAVKIPDDSYYVLGDNSPKSRDSRYFGFVARKDIYGKVMWIYTRVPFKRIFDLIRSNYTKK